ncbi:hypothetical protein ACFSR7_34470 [Cohnella sp. GCM10020058]|uniref:hypothetical protein n=1 Tax=Cohnella sp. GCM10020058 TaxID=3317330 RepID=UPI0036259A76
MRNINVIDAPCGYGKTSWAIQYMNEMHRDSHRFIYVTPFLDEVKRVKAAVLNRTFIEPESIRGLTKLEDLHRLLKQRSDIATTHALFQMANAETRKLIKDGGYTLILDEVMNVIEQIPLRKNDLDVLFNAGAIEYVEDKKGLKFIKWREEMIHSDNRYNDLKQMALSGNLMYCNNSAVIWNLPCDLFYIFRDVFILTYLFKGQLQRYYYDLHGIHYRYLSVISKSGKYSLVPYQVRQIQDKTQLKQLIHIYSGHLNEVGHQRYALSTSWLENPKNKDLIATLRKNTYNFLTNICKANKETALWTTVKGNNDKIKSKLQPRNFAGCFLPMTTRATNDYSQKYHLAYIINRFMNPIEKKFFEQYGVEVDQEAWALSELIQWVWRSRIRNRESITIYIPSIRMRGLFERYLTTDSFEAFTDTATIDQPASDWHV